MKRLSWFHCLGFVCCISIYGCSGKPIDYEDSSEIPDEPGLLEIMLNKETSIDFNHGEVENREISGVYKEVDVFKSWKKLFNNSSEVDQFEMWLRLKGMKSKVD